MASRPAKKPNPLITLGDALSLVFDAIALAQKGLLKNPSKEQERKLNRTLARLELERADIHAQILALIAKKGAVPRPTTAQVKEISDLTAEVDALTNASITASGAVALTSKILGLATEISDV